VTRYIVLLRGVNVGGHNKVPMAGFREVLESLHHADVATYIQSGNAVFTSRRGSAAKLATEIEAALTAQFAVDVRALVLNRTKLAQIRDQNPMLKLDNDPTHHVVAFLSGKPKSAAIKAVNADPAAPEQFEILGDVIYLHYPNGQGRSTLDFVKTFRGLGVWSTARNWRTVNKLIELADSV
jgi:uncharacterized protein (DUF1697 family)